MPSKANVVVSVVSKDGVVRPTPTCAACGNEILSNDLRHKFWQGRHKASYCNRKCMTDAVRGSAQSNSKLTEEQVREIKKSTQATRDLMRTYEVSEFCIWAIRNGKSWKHVEVE